MTFFSGKSRPGRVTPLCWLLVSSAHYVKPNGYFVLQAFPNCGANSDAIIIWCIRNGFDRIATDDELYRMGEATLLPAD